MMKIYLIILTGIVLLFGVQSMAADYTTVTADDNVNITCDNDNNSSAKVVKFTHDANPGSTEFMRIQENGKVGIGTTSPSATLHISSTSTTNLTLRANADDKAATLGMNTTGDFSISDYGSTFFKSTSGGDLLLTPTYSVGIGTTTPSHSYKLAVNGAIVAKEIKVQSTLPDYVFNKDYKLRPINDVNKYIKKYGHLPEVPSAKEVKENGVGLGEATAILLKKIEELTLYTIEQEKRIKELEVRTRINR